MLSQRIRSRPTYSCSSWRVDSEYICLHPRIKKILDTKNWHTSKISKIFLTPISMCDTWMESLWQMESPQNNFVALLSTVAKLWAPYEPRFKYKLNQLINKNNNIPLNFPILIIKQFLYCFLYLNRGSNSFFIHWIKINYRNYNVFIFFKNIISSSDFQSVRGFSSKTVADIKLKLVCGDSIRHKLSIHVSLIRIGLNIFSVELVVSQRKFRRS
jgi:hypothetical protein